ncbi:hypothetical protein NQZ68_000448 [Dissostichus eleginoides]|nr:hypothetical protein NQZ68_000448 [Dissostichus eleginoides]
MWVTSEIVVVTFQRLRGINAVQSLNSINDQIASFIVTGPKPVEPDQPVFAPPEKEPLQKSMTLMRHLLVDAQTAHCGVSLSLLPKAHLVCMLQSSWEEIGC